MLNTRFYTFIDLTTKNGTTELPKIVAGVFIYLVEVFQKEEFISSFCFSSILSNKNMI